MILMSADSRKRLGRRPHPFGRSRQIEGDHSGHPGHHQQDAPPVIVLPSATGHLTVANDTTAITQILPQIAARVSHREGRVITNDTSLL